MSGARRWYHCWHCGDLFPGPASGGVPERCACCGRDPVAVEARPAPPPGPVRAAPREREVVKRTAWRFVVGWVVAVLVLGGMIRWFQLVGDDKEEATFEVISESERMRREAYGPCLAALKAFFSQVAPEGRAAYVADSGVTLGKMVRMSEEQQVISTDEEPEVLRFELIETPRGKTVDSVWRIGQRRYDVAFYLDVDGAWRLDWEAMVRFSELSWPLFVAGVGEDEGEFRVLARRRSVGRKRDTLSLVLMGPRPGFPERIGVQSPEVRVDPKSRVGRIVEAALAAKERGAGAYGSKAAEDDPAGAARMRVKVKRTGEAERTFHLQDVVACHWLAIDDLGIRPKTEEEELEEIQLETDGLGDFGAGTSGF